jgi:hypothetical protein
MNILLKIFVLLLGVSSCMVNNNPECDYHERPYTSFENDFFDSIRHSGKSLFINRINYEYRESVLSDPNCLDNGTVNYEIFIDNEPLDSFRDSIGLQEQALNLIREKLLMIQKYPILVVFTRIGGSVSKERIAIFVMCKPV